MFRGTNELAIDDKGRIMLPVKFREALYKREESLLILTISLDKCLVAYPTAEWMEKASKIRNRQEVTPFDRDLKRLILGSANDCPLDKQGRILVPYTLKTKTNLEKNVVLVGMDDHFEIWNSERFYGNMQTIMDSPETAEIRAFRQDVGL
ncbi:MAG: division/cell wall cluster transcriptional repressor MraZ [Deltaproteobacteria bacterium]|jgi:MraZ protein|nr:division/cell wall cluster transcriptional repressor MraZ [Deltaproteobacteria bacterium]